MVVFEFRHHLRFVAHVVCGTAHVHAEALIVVVDHGYDAFQSHIRSAHYRVHLCSALFGRSQIGRTDHQLAVIIFMRILGCIPFIMFGIISLEPTFVVGAPRRGR